MNRSIRVRRAQGILPRLARLRAAAAGAAGAYVGSMAGALQGMGTDKNRDEQVLRRPAGIMLAVRIAEPQTENRVIQVLNAGGAADIEQAEGELRNGDWIDFDPL